MIPHWKIALWLGLFSEISDSKIKKKNKGKKKPGLSKKNLIPDSGPNKTWLVRGLVFATFVISFYFLFGYGASTYIDVKEIDCSNGSSGVKLKTSNSSNDYELDTFDSKKPWSAYANRIGFSTQEDIYEVTLFTKTSQKISFRVSKSKEDGSKDKHGHWVYRVGGGCSVKKCFSCSDSDKCDCCGSGSCTSGKCCCCCGSKTSCSCSSTTGSCACCEFIKWVDYAILNLESPNRITPASVFFSLLPSLLYLSFFFMAARSAAKGSGMGLYGQGGFFKMGKSLSKTAKSDITFDDVAGIKEEKQELEEIVDYLKNPSKYNAMGARTPRGVILYGPPGTGKTLLAKAVSGEAEVPFIEAAGSSFDDMFVGSGAKRVRELFAKARKLAPCIVFIDEIDAVAAKRSNKHMSGGGGGINDQTINQLLSEMDGFNTTSGIVVMAATNQLEVLDDAILRPGRFDRHIQISLPDIAERVEILKIHAKNKNLSSEIDLEDVARKTPGFSGAQLENVLNEATLLAVRGNKKVISKYDVDEAIDRTIAGPAKKTRKVIQQERLQVAYHEAGHAIAGLYSKGGDVVEKITIIPRGKAMGYMLSAPEKQESFLQRKDELLSQIITTLAGRAAEELFFGKDRISGGASNDLFKVTNMVRAMITKLGMSEVLGLLQYEPSEGLQNPYRNSYSEKSSEVIDKEMNRIIDEQYEKAKKIIMDNKEEYLLIVECLILIETIDKKQIDYIHTNKKLPKEAEELKIKLAAAGKEVSIDV